jgi:FtsP/CotA-like multicopper oxidase with cupredoxin domain
VTASLVALGLFAAAGIAAFAVSLAARLRAGAGWGGGARGATAGRRFQQFLIFGAALVGAVVLTSAVWAWHESRLPGSYNVMEFGVAHHGDGHAGHDHEHLGGGRATSVTRLEAAAGEPDRRFTLTARKATVRLSSGKTIDALTFDGTVPGPELRMREGELVEVTLVNDDLEDGVSIHWHGIDVPNREDGVAGVTQDAVLPGESYTYRFRAEQVGTFWYHTHQASARDVKRGLYGAVVILPAQPFPEGTLDVTAVAHRFGGTATIGSSDTLERVAVPPGTPVRLRLLNTDDDPKRFTLTGTPFRVLAIDGTDVNGPTPIEDAAILVGAGARFDVGFDMPDGGVRLALVGADVGVGFTARGDGPLPDAVRGPDFDPIAYGRPTRTEFDWSSVFDRTFSVEIGKRVGFLDGRPGRHWTLNGRLYPDMEMLVVSPGDLVKLTLANRTNAVHPMHLHGHHALVLSRDGERPQGSPWWIDTLNMLPGERYELAFRADNPGLWMFHCHNLGHAVDGLTTHLVYEGVTTPFEVGHKARNQPE